ncbi:MAG: NaeI family type II restriction endonuclease [Alteripontixanthobacter sp.]
MNLSGDIERIPLNEGHVDHADLSELEAGLLAAVGGWPEFERKLRGFFRSAIDEVIDTARTGRFLFAELEKTEKTYLGTKFEIILRDWLGVPKGVKLDFLIGEKEVDVKTSTSAGRGGWMIPPEAFDELCILIKVNEAEAICDFGLVRARPFYLRQGANRDAKTSLSAAGMSNIWWMANRFFYTPNFWSLIDHQDREAIFKAGGGSKRVAELFRRCQEHGISRIQVVAVGAQDDAMRRVRRGGGARDILAPEGIAILYSEIDAELMRELGISVGKREFVSYSPKNEGEVDLLRQANHID